MPSGSMVYSVVEQVSVSGVRENRPEIEKRFFSIEERDHLATRRDMTVAGFLALKKAMCRLVGRLAPYTVVSEADFNFSHLESGAPCLVDQDRVRSKAAELADASFLISVSHTREYAFGMVSCTSPGSRGRKLQHE